MLLAAQANLTQQNALPLFYASSPPLRCASSPPLRFASSPYAAIAPRAVASAQSLPPVLCVQGKGMHLVVRSCTMLYAQIPARICMPTHTLTRTHARTCTPSRTCTRVHSHPCPVHCLCAACLRADLCWQSELLLGVARKLVVGCDASVWPVAAPAAVALVLAIEVGSSYHAGAHCEDGAHYGGGAHY